MVLDHLVFLGFLGIAAYFDWKHKQVPDVLVASMFVFLSFVLYYDQALSFITVLSFSLVFLINSAYYFKKTVVLLGWSDVLVLPIVITMIYTLYSLEALIISGVALIIYNTYFQLIKKEKYMPLYPYFEITYIIFFIFSLL